MITLLIMIIFGFVLVNAWDLVLLLFYKWSEKKVIITRVDTQVNENTNQTNIFKIFNEPYKLNLDPTVHKAKQNY